MNKKKSSGKKKLKVPGFIKVIINFFRKIYQIIDRFIITPITKVFLKILDLFKSNNKPLDRLFNNKLFLITLSLVLSLTAFFVFDTMTDSIVNRSAEILTNIPVKIINGSEDYVVEGLPQTVDVTLIGETSYLYLAKQYAVDEIIVDLKGKTPRDSAYTVELKYMGSLPPSVEYKLDHATAEIHIYEKMTEARTVSSEIVNQDKIDAKYILQDIKYDENVYIQGPDYKINQVATVKALIDVTKINNLTTGTITKDDIPLVAYDANGEKIDVDIVPSKINASITIKSPSKTVPFKIEPVGIDKIAESKAIDTITLNETKVTIYGDEKNLANIDSIPVKIDVTDLNSSKTFDINVTKPSGVTTMNINNVQVKVTLGDRKEKTINGININIINKPSGYDVKAASQEDSIISVTVKGTESNLKNLNSENIQAYIDLQGYGEGTYDIVVNVTGDDKRIIYAPRKEKVRVTIKHE